MLIEVVTERFPALWALSSRGRDGPVAAELRAAQPLGCYRGAAAPEAAQIIAGAHRVE